MAKGDKGKGKGGVVAVPEEETTKLVGLPVAVDLDTVNMSAVFKEGYLDLAAIQIDADTPLDRAALGELAERVAANSRNGQFWYGDLLNYAKRHYGEEHAQYIDNLGHAPSYISDIMWVAGVFAPGERMVSTDGRPGLTWSHHKAVVKLHEDDPETTHKLMLRALEEAMSVKILRAEVRKLAAIGVGSPEKESIAGVSPVFGMFLTVRPQDSELAQSVWVEVRSSTVQRMRELGIEVTNVTDSVKGLVGDTGEAD